jgi:hypothetical protein
MALFRKKKFIEKDLPVIEGSVSAELSSHAHAIFDHFVLAKSAVQSVPGLQDYIVTSLVPRLTSAGLMGDLPKLIGILASDAVLGATVASIARTIKESLNAK